MSKLMDWNKYDIDIFSVNLPFYYKNKRKFSTRFSFIMSLLYIFFILLIFIIKISQMLKRSDLILYNSKIFPNNIQSFKINETNFNFIFGLKGPNKTARFIDETIYYPEVKFYQKKKLENNEWETINETYLNVTPCSEKYFDASYYNLFYNKNLSSSYCLKNYNNIEIKGGFNYDEFNYLLIKIFPCKNSSESKNICKSIDEIKKILESTYFIADTLDKDLVPSNYTFPFVQNKQTLYTSISNALVIDYILSYRIIEIQTDIGIFSTNIKKRQILQFEKEKYFARIKNKFSTEEREPLINIYIILSDKIKIQKREYKKLSNIFVDMGGYMELFFLLFSLIVLLPNNFCLEKFVINELFSYKTKEKVAILKTDLLNLNKRNSENKVMSPDYKKTKTPDKPKKKNFVKHKSEMDYKFFFKKNSVNKPYSRLKSQNNFDYLKIKPKDFKILSPKKLYSKGYLDDSKFQHLMKEEIVSKDLNKVKGLQNLSVSGTNNLKTSTKINFWEYLTGCKCFDDRKNDVSFYKKAQEFLHKELKIANVLNLILQSNKFMHSKNNINNKS